MPTCADFVSLRLGIIRWLQRAAKSLASTASARCKRSGIIIFLHAETLIRVVQAADA